jgi:hypothetical protein
MERDLLKRSVAYRVKEFDPVSRCRHVPAMKAQVFPIAAACEAAEVSTSAYYDWLARLARPSDAEWNEAILIEEMHNVHRHLDDSFGSPRMTDELRRGALLQPQAHRAPYGRHRQGGQGRPAQEGMHHNPRRQRPAPA